MGTLTKTGMKLWNWGYKNKKKCIYPVPPDTKDALNRTKQSTNRGKFWSRLLCFEPSSRLPLAQKTVGKASGQLIRKIANHPGDGQVQYTENKREQRRKVRKQHHENQREMLNTLNQRPANFSCKRSDNKHKWTGLCPICHTWITLFQFYVIFIWKFYIIFIKPWNIVLIFSNYLSVKSFLGSQATEIQVVRSGMWVRFTKPET